LFKSIFRKIIPERLSLAHEALQRDRDRRDATRINQVLFMTAAQDEDTIVTWLNSLNRFDEGEIMSAMELINASLLGFQAGPKMSQIRLIPTAGSFTVATERFLCHEMSRIACINQRTHGSSQEHVLEKQLILLQALAEAVIHSESILNIDQVRAGQLRQSQCRQFARRYDPASNLGLSPIEALKRAFVKFSESSGSRTPDDEELVFLLRESDLDGGGDLDHHELANAMSSWYAYLQVEPQVALVFNRYDVDRSGSIDRHELCNCLRDLNGGQDVTEKDIAWVTKRAGVPSGDLNRMHLMKVTTTWIQNLCCKPAAKAAKGNALKSGRKSIQMQVETAQQMSDHNMDGFASGKSRVIQVLTRSGLSGGMSDLLSEEEFTSLLKVAFPTIDQAIQRPVFRLVDGSNTGKASLEEFACIAGHAVESVDYFEPAHIPVAAANASEFEPVRANNDVPNEPPASAANGDKDGLNVAPCTCQNGDRDVQNEPLASAAMEDAMDLYLSEQSQTKSVHENSQPKFVDL